MQNNKAIRISKISLDLAGNKVELTVEQAKELQGILNELFTSRPNTDRLGDNPIIYPQIYPSWPRQGETVPSYPWRGWETWCSSEGNLNCKLT